MMRLEKLNKTQAKVFCFLACNVLGADVLAEFCHYPKKKTITSLRKLKSLSLAKKNKVGSWRLTPAGLLIWRKTYGDLKKKKAA